MSAGMADIIAAHDYAGPEIEDHPKYGYTDVAVCFCGARLYLGMLGETSERDDLHTAHIAEELTKAGYGNVQEALLAAADEMPIETLAGADKASVWLRARAHSMDPVGCALVQAIHDRKAASHGD